MKKEKNDFIFKNLDEQEELEYRLSARKNFVVFGEISSDWHPIYQMECAKMNLEIVQFEGDK